MTINPSENKIALPPRSFNRSVSWVSLVTWFVLFLSTPLVQGQADDSLAELRKNYLASVEELRTAIKAAQRAELFHFHVKSDEAFEYREQWETAAAQAEQAFAKLKEDAVALFLAEKNPDEDLIKTIRIVDAKLYLESRITRCYDVTKKLASLLPNDQSIQADFARISILNNDFETAAKFAKGNLGIIEDFEPLENGLYKYVDELKQEYARELELQQAEAEADDLPRVRLKTTKGDIVIELFENEAPETVANFISLVKIPFYDDIIFNPVYKKLLAQTGQMTETRERPTGYTIYDETQRKDTRRHFRGSVCMATTPGKANSGSAIFYILHVPGPHLVGRDTVFGRVISDMDVVDSLQPTKEVDDKGEESWIMDIVPDKIISAEVIRDRGHEYVPNRVKETSESSR